MCVNCEYLEWLETLDEMKDNVDFEFALKTLCGIEKWVRKNNHITEKQKNAIENIRASKRG